MSKKSKRKMMRKAQKKKHRGAPQAVLFWCLMLCSGCAHAPPANVVTKTSATFDECLAGFLEAHYAAPEESLPVPDCVERALIDYSENYTE